VVAALLLASAGLGLAPARASALTGAAEVARACQPTQGSAVAHCARAARGSAIPTWQYRMLDAVNALRRAAGAPAVHLCPSLTAAAQEYAATMARTGHYSHVGVDGSQPWDHMSAHGYSWTGAAENIAGGFSRVPVVMQAWHASAGHYDNLVNPTLQHVGFGRATVEGSPMGTYWVQDFAAGGRCD